MVILAFAATWNGQWAEARRAIARALELNPGSADILNQAATNMSYLGEPQRGAEMCDRSFQLNPSPPYWYDLDCFENYFFTGRHADVVDGIDRYRAQALIPSGYLLYRMASLAELGRTKEATAAVEELRQLDPAMSLESYLNTNLFAREQDMQQLLASARKAGIRACATEVELAGLPTQQRLSECGAKAAG